MFWKAERWGGTAAREYKALLVVPTLGLSGFCREWKNKEILRNILKDSTVLNLAAESQILRF